MYQHLYRRFITANKGVQHFGSHSHHYWPDVTRQAMLDYWDDSAQLVDDKWDRILGEKLSQVQAHIASTLNTGLPQQLVFAPNTHELLFRIMSCLDLDQPQTIVTTDSEFHSFTRQVKRLAEQDNIRLIEVPTLPFDNFEQRFINAIQDHSPDLVFFSQVFFNSALAIEHLDRLVNSVTNPDTLVVVDGYHGFMAVPTDLSGIAKRAFYLAGGYKYAQAGEGVCFAHVPPNGLRPLYTGWFAEFGQLDQPRAGQVAYSQDGQRFAGSTMDYSALYRQLAVFDMLSAEGIGVGDIHAYVQGLQGDFLALIDSLVHPQLNRDNLLIQNPNHHGHFLTFKLDSEDEVKALNTQLKTHGVYTDARGDRLRFGFGLYHNSADYNLSCLES